MAKNKGDRMRKIVILMMVLSFYTFGDSIESFLEYNLNPNFTFENGGNLEKDSKDLGLNFEFYSPQEGNSIGGFGIIQNKADIKNYYKNDVNLTTYYLVKKFYFTKSKFKPYIKLQGGAYEPSSLFGKTEINNPNTINLENGWYYGGGIGLEYNKVLIQVLYKTYLGNSQINGAETKFDYTTATISLGYSLGI